MRRPRRTWLFVPGADRKAHEGAARSGADVLIQELEDFTPPDLRPEARALAAFLYDRWRDAGALAAVRVNPLETCGREDLAAVMAGRPDIVLMSKVASAEQVKALEQATGGAVDLVPNVETAAGLMRTFEIATASRRVIAVLVASEDMVADLGTNRSRGGEELAYVRARFLVECRAAGVEAIDCPYTFSDVRGAQADAKRAKRLGYRAKSLVDPAHVDAINRVLTPSAAEIRQAERLVTAFEKARASGSERARVSGKLVEVPIYAAARRLLESVARTSPATKSKRR
ncbi:MAG TPA: CoA ester lyase [Burkholderiales bacterium]|jgi:citrate lyase subunit beta/citryl-CoA lyase|nr:CoA ester lyase [Burkholderiales bacterium]